MTFSNIQIQKLKNKYERLCFIIVLLLKCLILQIHLSMWFISVQRNAAEKSRGFCAVKLPNYSE